jgi:tRNA threonylcarbamoyladenosine biosynthesis protein TsaE
MSTSMSKTIISHSDKQTEAIAQKIASKLLGSEVIELVADLGGGKTTFVRGLARGIGSSDHVSSPSFTISNEYHGSKLQLIHFDFYRLAKSGLMVNSLLEYFTEPSVVVVVEWADIVNQVLPAKRLSIRFRVTSENARQLIMTYPKSLQYLVEKL